MWVDKRNTGLTDNTPNQRQYYIQLDVLAQYPRKGGMGSIPPNMTDNKKPRHTLADRHAKFNRIRVLHHTFVQITMRIMYKPVYGSYKYSMLLHKHAGVSTFIKQWLASILHFYILVYFRPSLHS